MKEHVKNNKSLLLFDAARAHPNILPMQFSNKNSDETTPDTSLGEKENEIIMLHF